MHHVTVSNLAGREHVHVTVYGRAAASVGDESRRAMEEALDLLQRAGAAREHLVRSRLFARDGQTRRTASDMRLEVLAGALRASSSSYIDPARLPDGASMAIELVGQRGAPAAAKSVREYEPRIAPPMFVTLDGVAYLSGITDVTDGFDAQLANIRASVERSLAAAGGARIAHIAAHVSRKVNLDHAWAAITRAFPADVALTLSPVDGYSAAEKLVEIETTALA